MTGLLHARLVSGALLALLLLGWAARGHCPMPGQAGDPGHGCCEATRISGPSGSCCHVDLDDAAPATREADRAAVSLEAAAIPGLVHLSAFRGEGSAPSPSHLHGPPLLTRRI